MIGDFNLILRAQDKSNSNVNTRLMGVFRNWVNDLELKELSLNGRRFTWSNDRTQTRIDRAFCTTDWDLMLPGCNLQALSSSVSDHSPLLLGQREVTTYCGFRFEVFWRKVHGDMVRWFSLRGMIILLLQTPISGYTLSCKEQPKRSENGPGRGLAMSNFYSVRLSYLLEYWMWYKSLGSCRCRNYC